MNTMLVAATALTAAAPVAAQDHEPMHLVSQSRANWVEIDDSLWGIAEYHAAFDGTGMWAESGERSNSGADGEASQWTRIDADYIGGFLYSTVYSFGGLREDAGSSMTATFEVDRTGMLHAFADFRGSFSDDLGEAFANMRLEVLDDNPIVSDTIFEWTNQGELPESAERIESVNLLLYPGTYRFHAEVETNVRGVSFGPDLGTMQLNGSIELSQLPDCGEPGAGSCSQIKNTPSCEDSTCCTTICSLDPYCCDNQWDELCVIAAADRCGPCPGDLNGDRVVNGADQGLLFAAWGPHAPTYIHPADLNADGVVNGLDLGILYSLWGDC